MNLLSKRLKSLAAIILIAFSILSFGCPVKASAAEQKTVWMQTVYKENNTIVAYFKVNHGSYNIDFTWGYIIVKDVNTGKITEVPAEKISVDDNYDILFKATYTPKDDENVRIKFWAMFPSMTGHLYDYYDDNNGYWYQA